MRARAIIVFLGTLGASTALSNSGCLCTSDQPCWPSDDTFAQLAAQVSQPLVYPLPSASACYPPSDPSGNCTDANDNWSDGNWHASLPGGMDFSNYETFMFQNGTIESCFLNTSITGMCEQGRVPVIGVDARSVGDIQAAVGFVVEHGLKLVIKNTGHDFLGRSAARGSFQLWTHNMKNITYDAVFVPQGAPTGDETFETLTFGAGVQWHEAYTAANQYGRLMVGGVVAGGSVGTSGGWLAGGGHSFLSPSYGLGVDNALEISIVLSTGEYLTTNAYQNSDLFWALRGGGGGTFGVVTSVTYRTYPDVPIQIWSYQGNVSNSSVLPEFVEGLLRFHTEFTDAGWGGYGGISNQQIHFIFFAPNMTNETVAMTTEGWTNYTQSLVPYGVVSTTEFSSSPWYDLIELIQGNGQGEVGGSLFITSRMLTRDSIATNASQVAEVLLDCQAGFNTIAGGKVSQFAPDSAGLNPAWRDAVIETVCAVSWDDGTSAEGIQGFIQQLEGWIQQMYDVTPNDAAYFNEASPFEVNWQNTFFGTHYPMLKSIKDKYDPYRLFVVVEGVGSEDWNQNLTCRYGS